MEQANVRSYSSVINALAQKADVEKSRAVVQWFNQMEKANVNNMRKLLLEHTIKP